jgi:hypothetical protein
MGPETHVHKITNVPVYFIWRFGLNDFDAGKSITQAIGVVRHSTTLSYPTIKTH